MRPWTRIKDRYPEHDSGRSGGPTANGRRSSGSTVRALGNMAFLNLGRRKIDV